MAEVQLDSKALDQLSHDHKGVLDAIDRLRSLGVGKLINLPQIIVVGDQSSGKSSVLEAISGVRFPSKGGTCTRFATELVLRQKPTDEIVVTIRTEENGESRQIFEEKRFNKEYLPTLIEQARKVMGLDDNSTTYSEEVLRVEVSGPKLLPLTLVDLPGFYHTGTSEQSSEGIAIVARLVGKYMKQKNSIILAVISAKSEISQHQVLEEVQKYDLARERTMGVITKPDTLDIGSSDEEKYVQLASNKEAAHMLKLGWHVLRNRNSEENGERKSEPHRISDEERDDIEAKFLRCGAWASYPSSNKGINSLRRKLSGILSTHIYTNLPSLVHNIESGLESRREALKSLGESRTELVEMREYLDDIFNKFRTIAVSAVKGTYDGKFFADKDLSNITEGIVSDDPRKLRAVIRNLNRAFAAVISTKGSKFRITDYPKAQADTEGYTIPGSLSKWVDQFQVSEPLPVSWSDMKSRLDLLASNNQGTRFPGSPNDELALRLFREQSERWKSIATIYVQLVTDATKDFVDLALQNVVPAQGNTREAVLQQQIEPFFELRSNELDDKLDELLKHYQEGDAVCLDDLFLADLTRRQKSQAPGQPLNTGAVPEKTPVLKPLFGGIPNNDVNLQTISSEISSKTEDEILESGLEAIIDMMNTYYSICLRTFMDNVIILGVENCLVSKLPMILNSKMIYSMKDETLISLAGETPDITRERITLNQEIGILTTGLQICKKHLPRKGPVTLTKTPERHANQRPESTNQTSTTFLEKTQTSSGGSTPSKPSPISDGPTGLFGSVVPKTSSIFGDYGTSSTNPSSVLSSSKSTWKAGQTFDLPVSNAPTGAEDPEASSETDQTTSIHRPLPAPAKVTPNSIAGQLGSLPFTSKFDQDLDFSGHLLASASGLFWEGTEPNGSPSIKSRMLHIGTTDAYNKLSTEEVRLGYTRYMEKGGKASEKPQ